LRGEFERGLGVRHVERGDDGILFSHR
jgi:hypothetical protein